MANQQTFNPLGGDSGRGDFTYVSTSGGGAGTGDVVGPAGATANAIARYNATTGKLIQDSVVTIDSVGNTQFGNTTATLTATPLNVSFGGTYGSAAPGSKANLKWDLYTNAAGADRYGIGMSAGLMEFQAGNSAGFSWYVNAGTLAMNIASTGILRVINGLDLSATNIVTDTTTGLKIGTATTQKVGFFAATPVVQPAAGTDLATVLSALGLRAAGAAWPLTTSGTITFSGNLVLTGPFKASAGVQTATSIALTIANSSEYQLVSAAAGNVSLSLPGTSTAGQRYTIKKTDATVNTITITAATSIDGAANYVLSTQYKYVTVISTVTSGVYYIVGNN